LERDDKGLLLDGKRLPDHKEKFLGGSLEGSRSLS
jgi:hypothetical protein